MIKDSSVAKIKESWNGVVKLQGKVKRAIGGAIATGGISAINAADAANNLPFVHACSVLNETLKQLLVEKGVVDPEKQITLGAAVGEAEKHLNWNPEWIEGLVKKRNGLAHDGEILPRAECWDYMEKIENQLRSWKVI